jgi:hypothetical protein
MPPSSLPDRSRRQLLGRASQAAAAAAAVAVVGPIDAVAATEAAIAPPAESPPKGYHETEHTRRYYRLARY